MSIHALTASTLGALILVATLHAAADGDTPSTASPTLQALLDARTAALPGSGIIVGEIRPAGVTITVSGSSGTARPLDAHSLFEIGSVTKTFTATILASMVLDGSVKLDDPVANYLPAGVHVPTRNGKAITLLNLATQHSGLPRLPTNLADVAGSDPYARYSVADMYAFLSAYTLPRDPGAAYEYSNFGIALLGQALANAAHTTYGELLRRRVLDPLGMHDTTLTLSASQRERFTVGRNMDDDVVPPWTFAAIEPAGALHASLDDLVRFVRANLGRGPLAPACLFAQAPRATLPGNQIGLVWMTGDQRHFIFHDGDTAGYHAGIAIAPDRASATIVLANGGLPVTDIAFHTLDATIPIATVAPAIALDSATLEGYVGTYHAADMGLTFTIARNGDRLTAQLTGQPPGVIIATAKDEFVARSVDARFTFVRDDDGRPSTLVLRQNGGAIVFVRPGATVPDVSALVHFPAVVALDPPTLAAYVGTYAGDIGTFTVTRDGAQLFVQLGDQPSIPVFPSQKDRFFYKVVKAQIDFERDDRGHVTGLTLHQNGADYRARRE